MQLLPQREGLLFQPLHDLLLAVCLEMALPQFLLVPQLVLNVELNVLVLLFHKLLDFALQLAASVLELGRVLLRLPVLLEVVLNLQVFLAYSLVCSYELLLELLIAT